MVWKVSPASSATMRLQRPLHVFAHEEVRVREARAQHVLVALLHQLQVLVIAVADRNEVGQQLPVLLDREVALVLLHHRDQHLARQTQVLGLEIAEHRGRLFDQVGGLGQQVVVQQRLAAHQRRGIRHLLADRVAPVGEPGTMPARCISSRYWLAERISTAGEPFGRSPREVLPERTPAYSNGIMVSPYIAAIQRIGREKDTPELFQRIDLSNLTFAITPGSSVASREVVAEPAIPLLPHHVASARTLLHQRLPRHVFRASAQADSSAPIRAALASACLPCQTRPTRAVP